MLSIVIVDSGPLIAAANRSDPDHAACAEVLQRPGFHLVVPALCVAEAAYLLGTRKGPQVEAAFLRQLRELDVRSPEEDDWERIAELVERYADLPLGATDASVLVQAERCGTGQIVTLDRRHFQVVRPKHRPALELLP